MSMTLKMIHGIPIQIWGCLLGSATQDSYLYKPLIYIVLFSLGFPLNTILDNDLQIFSLNKNVAG